MLVRTGRRTAAGVSTISGALRSRDTDLMIGALQALGLRRIDGSTDELTVGGTIAPPPQARIDCGLVGTVLRFVPVAGRPRTRPWTVCDL